jgi:hypothetical protein
MNKDLKQQKPPLEKWRIFVLVSETESPKSF